MSHPVMLLVGMHWEITVLLVVGPLLGGSRQATALHFIWFLLNLFSSLTKCCLQGKLPV